MKNLERLFAEKLLKIKAIKLQPANPFTWASGWKSPFYCDNRKTLSYPSLRNFVKIEITRLILERFGQVDAIAGVATGAIPQGALVADALNLPFVYVRSTPKDHGLENLIEGELRPGMKVVVVEDLISTGGSSLKAVEAIRRDGCEVIGMVAAYTMVPDSLSWGKDPIANNPVINTAEKQKVVTLGDKILLFAQNNEIYSTAIPAGSPTDRLNYGQKWDKETTGKLPVGADITSIIRFVDKLYLLAENKEVYNSNDGLTWTKDEVLNSDGVSVTNLITSFSDSDGSNHKKINGIAGIVEINGEKYFSFAEKDATWEKDIDKLTAVPAEFPINNLSADVYATESGTLNAIVVGNTKDGLDNDTATVVWASEDGKSWIPMEIPSNNNCPKLVDPSIIQYNDSF